MRRSRIIAFALVLLILAPRIGEREAAAYENEHYVWTYFLAVELGFTKRQAYQIASGAYAIDFDRHTGPMEARPGDAIFGADHTGYNGTEHPEIAGIWRDFHAFADETIIGPCGLVGPDLLGTVGPSWSLMSVVRGETIPLTVSFPPLGLGIPVGQIQKLPECSRETKMAVFANRQRRREALWALAMQERNPGPLIHYVQDYYAHFPYTNFRGHALAGHAPDFLSWNSVNAEQMTLDTITVLLDFRNFLGTFSKDKSKDLPNNLLRQSFGAPEVPHILAVMKDLMAANPAPSITLLDKFLKDHPDVSLLSVVDYMQNPDYAIYIPSGVDAKAPKLERYKNVVDSAIAKDEEAGLVPKWPSPIEGLRVMPMKWAQYTYTSTGHINEPVEAAVEKVTLEFGAETASYTPLDESGSKYKVSLSLPYKISGLARIYMTPTDKYLDPVPAIERHEFGSNKTLPRKSEPYDKQVSNGDYTATYNAELSRQELESGDWSWDVSVQLYGYEPKTRKVQIRLPYQACSPQEGKIRESLSVSSNWPGAQVKSAQSLEKGKCYTIDVRGERLGSDAIYCFADWRCDAETGQPLEEITLSGSGLIRGSMGTIPYQPDHRYRVGYIGRGEPLTVGFSSADSTGEFFKQHARTERDGCSSANEGGCRYQVDIIDPDTAACRYETHDPVYWQRPEGPSDDLSFDLKSFSLDQAVETCKADCDRHSECSWYDVKYPGTSLPAEFKCGTHSGDLPTLRFLSGDMSPSAIRFNVGLKRCGGAADVVGPACPFENHENVDAPEYSQESAWLFSMDYLPATANGRKDCEAECGRRAECTSYRISYAADRSGQIVPAGPTLCEGRTGPKPTLAPATPPSASSLPRVNVVGLKNCP